MSYNRYAGNRLHAPPSHGVTLDRGLLRNDLEGLYWEIIKQHKLRIL